jgi:1-aminocyclopropane-1-carboxylate deaminase/D-cysteine desulfhydrase-like pyridoxal-dependent ACC family enzyme
MKTIAELRKKMAAFPRVPLAQLPTPLHEVPRFARALGGPRIFVKRDDCTGLAFGGNKTRMFEFLLGRAREAGADTVVGGAGTQSNYCRQLAAACSALGLETHLVLRRVRGPRDDAIQGNLLLMLLAGARVHIMNADPGEQRRAMYDLAGELEKKGKKVFVARMAADEDLTPDCISYVECYCEIHEQCAQRGIAPTHLYVSSYDSTQAGLEAGRAALGDELAVRGIAPARWDTAPAQLIARYANQTCAALRIDASFDAGSIYNTTAYVGEGYGIPTPGAVEMIKLMARTEGLYVDPVYTSKVLAAVSDHVNKGDLTGGDTVLFLHTGGTPALFAYTEELQPDELAGFLNIDDL